MYQLIVKCLMRCVSRGWQSGRGKSVVDALLNRQPVKLSENKHDVISHLCFVFVFLVQFSLQTLNLYLAVLFLVACRVVS